MPAPCTRSDAAFGLEDVRLGYPPCSQHSPRRALRRDWDLRLAAISVRIPPRSSVLACLSDTRPFLGRSFQDTQYSQIVRYCATILARVFVMEAIMAIGTVKFFDSSKGFGFIQPESGEKDVFVHISAVQNAGMDTLTEGQRISYEVITERGKLAASNLKAA
jgi:CspA family cold shock protein